MDNVYAFETAPSQKNGAVFLTLENNTSEDIALINAESPVAEIVELHENLIDPDDGMMLMRRVKQIVTPAKTDTYLEPTGFHIMLINLEEPLTIDSTFPITLHFDNGEKIETTVIVAPLGSYLLKLKNTDVLVFPPEDLIDEDPVENE
ncbi:MAG: copper chaperone PCu(A)C [Pseudomonadota bacterium]